jgi:phosphatidylglycerol---prolipoprotein diacylglyceryl transferase
MYPVLFHIGSFAVESFWVAVVVGFLCALVVARAELRRCGHDPDLAYDLILWAYIGGFVGARLFLIFTAWDVFVRDPFDFLLSGSGWVWQGGVIGGAVAVFATARRHGLSFGDLADLSGLCLSVGQAIGRIGCQLAGDGDYGIPTSLPWGMSYPNGVVPTLERVHPTPIYEALIYFALFYALWYQRHRLRPRGSLFAQYLVFAGAGRLLVEFVRRNPVVALGLTLPQWVSVAWIVVGVLYWRWLHARSASST